jgi:TetR/AcrR family transcriptional regulator
MVRKAAARKRRASATPRPGRPPGADADATRTAILEGALEAFASAGYDAVSVRELTRRLGVSHNLVHHYFGSKQKLWHAVLDYAVGEQIGEVVSGLERGLDGQADPFESLAGAIRQVVALFARLPSLPRLLMLEAAWGGERLDHVYEQYLDPFFRVAKTLRERVVQAGGERVDLRSFALVVLTACGSLFTHASVARRMGGPEPFSSKAVERHADSVVALVMDGLRPRR